MAGTGPTALGFSMEDEEEANNGEEAKNNIDPTYGAQPVQVRHLGQHGTHDCVGRAGHG